MSYESCSLRRTSVYTKLAEVRTSTTQIESLEMKDIPEEKPWSQQRSESSSNLSQICGQITSLQFTCLISWSAYLELSQAYSLPSK